MSGDRIADPFRTDMRCVARQFGRAAASYEQEAVLQQTMAARLIERLQYMKLQPERILDLGSGTGRAARALSETYPKARILELDVAPAMLRQARPAWWRRVYSRRSWICADAQHVPLPAASIDLVFSSLMLQWCNQANAVFAEVARLLRPGGLFLFATLGPDTLRELRESWARADESVHVNAFLDMHDLGDALLHAGLVDPVMETERFTLTYANVYALMRDLKLLGAQNANTGRRRTLTGKDRMGRMAQAYEQHRHEDLLPATYEAVYGHAWGSGHARRLDAQTAVFPVAALRRHAGGSHDGGRTA